MNVSFTGNSQLLSKVGTAIKNNKLLEKARNVPPSALVGTAIVLGAGAYAAHLASKSGQTNFTPLTGVQTNTTKEPELGTQLSISG